MTDSHNNTHAAASTPVAPLTIISTRIRQDGKGRYCLNDCHKASGSEKKNGPSYFLATEGARKLASSLDSETTGKSVVTVEGRNGGTYVARELVYAYAMWVSVDFQKIVIRAFDAMVQGLQPHVAVSGLDPEVIKVIGGVAKAVMGRQIEPLRRLVTILTERLEAVTGRYDPTAGFITDYAPMSSFINPLVPNPRKRDVLVRRASVRCQKWLINTGRGNLINISRESARRLYQCEATRQWMDIEGKILIREHNDKIAGQTVMEFKPKIVPKKPDTEGRKGA